MKNIYVVKMADGRKQDWTANIEHYGKEAVVVEVARRQRKENLIAAIMAMRNAGEHQEITEELHALEMAGWIKL